MIIDRAAVKQQAKEIVRFSKPSLLTAGLIIVLLGALINYLSLRLTGVEYDTMTRMMQAATDGRSEAFMTLAQKAMPGPGESLIDLLLQLAMRIVGVGFTLFTLNTIRRSGPVLENLLDGFGMMPKLLFLLVLEYVLIMLWSLLFVIPGIIAAYRYSLAVFVMIDHPELSAIECLRESKRHTTGNKGQLFMLDLSFILWLILSAAPVIGYAVQVFLTPYMETCQAMYYEKIRLQGADWASA